MPYNSLKDLSMGCDRGLVDDRDHHTGVCDLCSKVAISANYATDFGADFLRKLQGTYQDIEDISLNIPIASGEYDNHIPRIEVAGMQPIHASCFPTLIVHPRSQLAYIIGRCLGLDPGDLLEVIDSVRSVSRPTTHLQEQ
jgi:hypothetical protein